MTTAAGNIFLQRVIQSWIIQAKGLKLTFASLQPVSNGPLFTGHHMLAASTIRCPTNSPEEGSGSRFHELV